jgi:hypothetical protein
MLAWLLWLLLSIPREPVKRKLRPWSPVKPRAKRLQRSARPRWTLQPWAVELVDRKGRSVLQDIVLARSEGAAAREASVSLWGDVPKLPWGAQIRVYHRTEVSA